MTNEDGMPHFYRPDEFTFPDKCAFGELDGCPVVMDKCSEWELSIPEAPKRLPPGIAFSDEFGFVSEEEFYCYLNKTSWSRCETERERSNWIGTAAYAYFEMDDWSVERAWSAFKQQYHTIANEPMLFEKFVASWSALDEGRNRIDAERNSESTIKT